jgi:hypothetical protein
VTIAAGQTQPVTFTFDAAALAGEGSTSRPAVAVHVVVSGPAEYADTMTAPLPPS